MIRALSRAAAAGVIGALAGAAWLALFYGWSSALTVDFDVDPPPALIRGAYPAERDSQTGTTFAWTGDVLTISIDDIDRRLGWRLDVRVRGARGNDAPNPVLEVFVDGVRTASHQTGPDYSDLRVELPGPPATHRATIELRPSSTFVPGPHDKRRLGVMIDRITLTPGVIGVPPGAAFAGVVTGAAAIGMAIALLGVTAGSAIGGSVLVSAALAALVAHGFAPYTAYPVVVARVCIWTAVVTVALTLAVARRRTQPFRNTARFAIAFSAAAFLAKLLLVLHPGMPIGDALFQAHRFHEVLSGRIYFTSIAPGNYQFPYAPGLYVAAMPFAGLVRRGPADMALLRTIVCVADVAAGLLLYNMAVRIRGDRLAGAIAVALYHLTPLGFGVIAAGNLTNAFAQSFAVMALALMAAPALRWQHRGLVIVLAAVLLASFLSHTSAFAIVTTASIAIALVFAWRGGPALRSPAGAVLVAAVAAAVLAVVLYYAHFADTYRTELARIGSETAGAAPDAGGRGTGGRLASVPRYLHIYYGVPILALAAAGGGLLWQRGARDRVTLACAGWLAACGMFWLLGILTPVDMRHYLAAIPAIAVLGGAGAAIAWTRGTTPRIAATALLGWSVVAAVHAWWSTLT